MGSPQPHRARKRFGQHFLVDEQIIDRIVRAIHPAPTDSLIEIGPGQGALTLPLLRISQRLTAIELDRDLVPLLEKRARGIGELELINEDILRLGLSDLPLPPPLRIVGNLPYNISTPLMFHLLNYSHLIGDMHFMLQKEVALRIIAQPGNTGAVKHYGRLSVMMRYHCDSEYLFDVPPGSFSPPPKVDSAVIRLRPHAIPRVNVSNLDLLEQVVQAAFNQRRKTIANSLGKYMTSDSIRSLGIDPRARAENLTLEDFAHLANAVNEM